MFQQFMGNMAGKPCMINPKLPQIRGEDSRSLLPFLVGAALAFPVGYIASNTNKNNYPMNYQYPPVYPYPQYPQYQMPIYNPIPPTPIYY